MFRFATLRAAARSARAFTTESAAAENPAAKAFVEERAAIKAHASGSGELWRKITFYVAFPAIVVGYLNGTALMAEHEAHLEHIKEENGGEAPERIVYPYMNKRIKDFPWASNNTLFYNPRVNVHLPEEE